VSIAKGKIEGVLLEDRYFILSKIDFGSFGKIYKCSDLFNKDRPLVVKILEDKKFFLKEI